MDGASAVASIIAVLDASVKVITLCSQYSAAVVSARADITRLETQVISLKTCLDHAKALIEASDNLTLPASRELVDQLQGCQVAMQELQAKLGPSASRKAMRRFGARALMWPFSHGELEAKLSILERYQRRIMDGLQIDQTTLLLNLRDDMANLSLQTNEDASIALRPHFVVPFPRDPDYVRRSAVQTWLHEQQDGHASRIALVGLGGFGKSQIAIELAHEVHCSLPGRSVFWVYGSTKATFESSYRSIADRLDLPRRHEPNTNILALVRDWLQREDVARWLMIVDNADDLDVFFAKNEEAPIASYLPKTSNGQILVTSRNLNVAEKLIGSHKAIKQISTMGSAEALQLLQNKLIASSNESAALDLVHLLGLVPLAVSQAVAYINRRHLSVHSYMERFQESEKQKANLLSHDAGDIRRHESVSNSVVVTWQVTFEQIRRESPAAANLLLLMSLFNPQNIPQHILSGYGEVTMNRNDDRGECVNLQNDLDVLLAYSLINTSATPGFCEMHSLVQFCTRRWLLKSEEYLRWKRLFLQLASKHFPNGDLETWQILFPHVEGLLGESPTEEVDMLPWSVLLTNTSWYMATIGDYARAESLVQHAVEVRTRLLGEENADTLTSMAILASTYRKQGRWEEAKKLGVRVIETSKTKLGPDHLNTLSSMANLAATYRDQGQWEEAKKLELQVMETRRTKLGPDHPDTIVSIANLALTYRNQGQWEEAKKLLVELIKISKAKLGLDHTYTLWSMAILASTYRNQGHWEEAEKLEVQIMETRRTTLGPDHPDTLSSMGNLAATYRNQGRWDEAEKLEVYVISKTKLGPDHPNTLLNKANLAATYRNQGRWQEAKKLEVQVMEISKTKLGLDHPDTLWSMASLAATYWNQGQWAEAEKLFVQVVDTRKTKLGPDHPDTLTSMNNLAFTLKELGRVDEALGLMDECISLRRRVLGLEHPHTKTSIAAMTLWKQDRRQYSPPSILR